MSKKHPLKEYATNLFFDDHGLLTQLYGEEDEHLKKIESMLHIEAIPRGNMLSLSGNRRDVVLTERILMDLYQQLRKGVDVGMSEVIAAIRMAPPVSDAEAEDHTAQTQGVLTKPKQREGSGDIFLKTQKKTIRPYTHVQANYLRELFNKDLVFAIGPAGTGKTYLAMAMAIHYYLNRKVERIILSRPAVEAGEKLGFLPGDLKEKIDPYLRPLYDALFDMLPAEKVNDMIAQGEIEVAPLAFMRGRTLSHSFIVLDEAQNTTSTQMKMFLTRLGENSRMVITGDLTQTDLPKDIKSGLKDCLRKISHIEEIGVISFSDGDVVRHPLAARIVKAYDDWDKGVRPPMEEEHGMDDAER